MDFRLLGPLEVVDDDGHDVAVRSGQQRALLAVLLLRANELVPSDVLVEELWGESPPPTAHKMLHNQVSALRRALGSNGRLETRGSAYRLKLGDGERDVDRFEALVARGRERLDSDPEEAAAAFREALGLWRGPALADLSYEAFAPREVARLEDVRVSALEQLIEAQLELGQHAEVVGQLETLIDEHPYRERLRALHMLALYRCRRQAEALDAYREARDKLVDEIGVEPGPDLRRLQAAILQQDESLDPTPSVPDLPRELDATTAPPLVGRVAELAWLRELWARARDGAGALVTVTGARGIGKTRIAAEIAGEAHRVDASVLYVAGTGPPEAMLVAFRRAREPTRPTLLVIDDADRARPGVLAEVRTLARLVPARPVLALASGEDAGVLGRLEAHDARRLEPLGPDAVREIAVLYAPGRTDEEVPVERLLEDSDGVPLNVHRVARQWAGREAARRVDAVAGRAAAGRAELRSMEAELAGGVAQLQTARGRGELHDGGEERVVCPFKGLAAFEAADAPYFFGREELLAELVARLVGAPLLGVVGPSGSGKSSVVRAGLLPALAEGVLPGSEHWAQVLIRPGEHPLRELPDAIDELGGGQRGVLAVDQFEETFTVCRDEEERSAFISELARLAHDAAVVVVALRADYYARCAAYPELSRLLAANHVLVGPMRREELERAVVCPAERSGLHVEEKLVKALIRDVEDAPGGLPLLSAALLELWKRRDGRRLPLAAYERTGGVRTAVGRLAEEAFSRLDEDQHELARRVLLRLVDVDDEGRVERRRVPLEELDTEGSEDLARVLGLLADSRLLTISEGTVEVAHEALLREWPRLQGWIEDDLEGLRIQRSLSSEARDWLRVDRDEGALYQGARLAEAREWSDRTKLRLNALERDFLDASLDRDRRERRTERRRLAIVVGSLTLGIVVIAAIAVVALDQRRDAVRQRDIASSRELALQSANALDANPGLALRLALSAVDKSATDEAAAALRQATLAVRQLGVLPADSLTAQTAAYSPDGTRIVTGGQDGIVRVWDTASGREKGRLAASHGAVLAARYAPSGDRLALGFADGTLALTDASLGAPRVVFQAPRGAVHSVAFARDAERVAAALGDGTVRIVATDGSGRELRLSGHRGAVLGVDISTDGRAASAGKDGTIRLWNAVGGGTSQILHAGTARASDVRFSPDGSRLLGVGFDGWLRVWDARTGAEERQERGDGRPLAAAAFSPDGRRLAAGGHDGVIRVWSVSGGPPVAVLTGQRSRVYDIGFGARSDRVVSAGDDGTVRIWDAGRTQVWTGPSVTRNIDFNPDGRFIASGSDDGTVRVWSTATGRLHATLPGPDGYTTGRFSPTADEIVIASDAGSSVSIWPIASDAPEVVANLPEGRGMNAARFDGTGDRIVFVDTRGVIVVRDLRSGRDVVLRGAPKDVYDAQLSPGGGRVAAGTESGDVLVWRLDRPARPERELEGHRGHVNAVAYSRDGRIVTAGADRTVRVWDADGEADAVLRGHDDEVTTAIFTNDGARVLSSGNDGTVRLWESRGGEALAVLQSGSGEVYDVALSRDGRIATLGKGEVVRVFECEVCGSLEEVRALAHTRLLRPLTRD